MSTKIIGKFKPNTKHFGQSTEEEKDQLLQDRDAKDTNKSIKTALTCF